MKVQATRTGHYGNTRYYEGEVFDLVEVKGFKQEGIQANLVPVTFKVEQQFSPKWMKKVGNDTVSTKSRKEVDKPAKNMVDELDVI